MKSTTHGGTMFKTQRVIILCMKGCMFHLSVSEYYNSFYVIWESIVICEEQIKKWPVFPSLVVISARYPSDGNRCTLKWIYYERMGFWTMNHDGWIYGVKYFGKYRQLSVLVGVGCVSKCYNRYRLCSLRQWFRVLYCHSKSL